MNGIQLYTCRDKIRTYEDCDKTFEYLSSIGVKTVQISGIGPIPQPRVAELVEKYGFDVCVTHTGFDRMKTDIQAVIDDHKLINCDCLGIGSMPEEYRKSLADVRRFIADTAVIGKAMLERGCHFAYHNHSFEYEKIDGDRTIMDVLLEETDPELFWFIPDVAWIDIGGDNPCEALRRMQGRCKVVHFKDYKEKLEKGQTFCELGEGRVDLRACYSECKRLGIPYIVFEQDTGWINDDPLESCRISFEYMNKIAD